VSSSSPLKGQTALVTGASSGLGRALARELASRGADLVVAARREDVLVALARELEQAHGVSVEALGCDLARPDGAEALFERASANRPLSMLVSAAGCGHYGPFAERPLADHSAMLELNVQTPTKLVHRFLKHRRVLAGRGRVLIVSSVAAFQPIPGFAAYAASKSYLGSFAASVALEARANGVDVTCVYPGRMQTGFSEIAGQRLRPIVRRAQLTPEHVAREAVDAMLAGKSSIVVGRLFAAGAMLNAIVPRVASARLAGWLMSPPR
jgi:short-subunit dehydrogenase